MKFYQVIRGKIFGHILGKALSDGCHFSVVMGDLKSYDMQTIYAIMEENS
jgi:hypothetical protein